jgi:hypothetical protein
MEKVHGQPAVWLANGRSLRLSRMDCRENENFHWLICVVEYLIWSFSDHQCPLHPLGSPMTHSLD